MPTTVAIYMPQRTGITGDKLKLTKSTDFSAFNGAGDTLTESGTSGWFTCSVATVWTVRLGAAVVDSDGLVPVSGSLGVGKTVVEDAYIESSSGGGDALLSNQVLIISHLVDIKGAGWSSSTASLEKIREAIDIGESLIGPGSDFCTMEIKDDGVAVESASVWVSTDSAGSDVIAGTLPTNGLGRVRFLLTAGTTYYLWANKAGKISIQGEPFVAAAD